MATPQPNRTTVKKRISVILPAALVEEIRERCEFHGDFSRFVRDACKEKLAREKQVVLT